MSFERAARIVGWMIVGYVTLAGSADDDRNHLTTTGVDKTTPLRHGSRITRRTMPAARLVKIRAPSPTTNPQAA